jgi:hypothetical protein
MANGNVRVLFDGINLDNCIKVGLELTGTTNCTHCKQPFSFEVRLQKRTRSPGNVDSPTSEADNDYDVCLFFSRNLDMPKATELTSNKDDDGPCVPCNGCTMNCKKLAGR